MELVLVLLGAFFSSAALLFLQHFLRQTLRTNALTDANVALGEYPMYSNYRQKGTRRLCQMSGGVTEVESLRFSLLNPALINDIDIHTMRRLNNEHGFL